MKIFSFDAEPEGLYGPPFAVGAVVVGPDFHGQTCMFADAFAGYIQPAEISLPWVQERINAVLDAEGFTEYNSLGELLESFWDFWLKHREGAVCVSDWGYPVEVGVMRRCVEVDVDGRQFLAPAPLHEVSTALLSAGIDPNIDRIKFAEMGGLLIKHNPTDDAMASAICFRKAIRS